MDNKFKLHFYFNKQSGAFSFPFKLDEENVENSVFGDVFSEAITDPISKRILEIYPKVSSLLMIVTLDSDLSYVVSEDSTDLEPKEELILMVREILKKIL